MTAGRRGDGNTGKPADLPEGPLSRDTAAELACKLDAGELALFAGAGLSRQAEPPGGGEGLPGWSGMIEQIAEPFWIDPQSTDLGGLKLLARIEDRLDRETLNSRVREVLDDADLELSPTHETIGRLPWTSVLTTNYDRLLERALGTEESVATPRDWEDAKRPADAGPKAVYHVHGTFEQPHTLTKADYRGWDRDHPYIFQQLLNLFANESVLFVGYSLEGDPHLERLRDWVERVLDQEHNHFLALHEPDHEELAYYEAVEGLEVIPIHDGENWPALFDQLRTAFERERGAPIDEAPPGDPHRPARRRYARRVRRERDLERLHQLYLQEEEHEGLEVRLSDVFVEPDLVDPSKLGEEDPEAAEVEEEPPEVARLRERQVGTEFENLDSDERESAFEALANTDAVLVKADPGRGKSTLARLWLLDRLGEWAEDPDQHPFPVYLRLPDWEEQGGGSLAEYAKEHHDILSEIDEDAADAWLDGDVLWILDGIDEVRDTVRRENLEKRVRNRRDASRRDEWLVVSRPTLDQVGGYGLDGTLEVAPLTDEQARELVENWATVIAERTDKDPDSDAMWTSFEEKKGLRDLRRNPFNLAAGVLFRQVTGRLPENRWDFYNRTARFLRDRWAEREKQTADDALPGRAVGEILEELALEAMRAESVEIPRETVEEVTHRVLDRRDYTGRQRDEDAERFLGQAEDQVGVLRALGPDTFSFLHLTFQEFYAARCLERGPEREGRDLNAMDYVAAYWDHPDWQEVFKLYALGIEEGGERHAELFETLLGNPHTLDTELHRHRLFALELAGMGDREVPGPARDVVNWAGIVIEAESPLLLPVLDVLGGWDRELLSSLELALVERLTRDNTWIVRRRAGNALTSAADHDYILDALLRPLTENDERVIRPGEVQVLTELADHERVREALLNHLKHDSSTVRRRAIDALSEVVGHEQVQVALLHRVTHDEDRFVRRRAAEALAEVANYERVREALLNHLTHDSSTIRSRSAQALAQVADHKRVREALVDRLTDDTSTVRRRAVQALDDIVYHERIRDVLLDRLRNDEDQFVRTNAIEALAEVADDERVREALLNHLKHDSSTIRRRTVTALAEAVNHGRVREALLDRLRNDEDRFVRTNAIEALAEVADVADHEDVRQAILDHLTHDSSTIRSRTAQVLAPVADHERVQEALLERITDNDSTVRRRAIDALSGVVDHEHVQVALLDRLSRDEPQHVRAKAAEILAEVVDHGNVRDALLDRLSDDASAVRTSVIDALAQETDQDHVREAILRHLTDGTATVRTSAIEALAEDVDREQVRDALLDCLTEEDASNVRRRAIQPLADFVHRDPIQHCFLDRLTDDDPIVRIRAARALGHASDNPRVRERLIERLAEDPEHGVRAGIHSALASYAVRDRHG